MGMPLAPKRAAGHHKCPAQDLPQAIARTIESAARLKRQEFLTLGEHRHLHDLMVVGGAFARCLGRSAGKAGGGWQDPNMAELETLPG